MKLAVRYIALLTACLILPAGLPAAARKGIQITPVTLEEIQHRYPDRPVLTLPAGDLCDAGNTMFAYTVTNFIYGAEHFSAYVDPSACFVTEPGIVRPASISMVLYATEDIFLCGSFLIQAHIEAAEGSGGCYSPGFDALCVSDLMPIVVSEPGLWLITIPLNDDCLFMGPFFATFTFFNDAGCLPGPLNIVIDSSPEYCHSYNNYDGYWYDIVYMNGLPGKLTLFSTVESIDPKPDVLSIEDVQGDEGGSVTLTWKRSELDTAIYNNITHYSVWRRIPSSAVNETGGDALMFHDGLEIDEIHKERIFHPGNLGDPYAWEWINNVPAHCFDVYALTVQTSRDSSGEDPAWQHFMVSTQTADVPVFWDSAVDSGYSVDNIAPCEPRGLSGMQSMEPSGLLLEWDANTETDLSHYNLYRGGAADFPVGAATFIAYTSGTDHVDTEWIPGSTTFYKLTAADLHGNLSDPALLDPDEITVGTLLLGFSASFSDNAIEISWTLKEEPENSSFVIHRNNMDGPGGFVEIGDPSITKSGAVYTFLDMTCVYGKTYIYRVELHQGTGETEALFETGPISTPAFPLTLSQNHPNPFNPVTTISYFLPETRSVRLEIFDTSGRLIARLADGKRQNEGHHEATWNGRDRSGNIVAAGVYFYRLAAGKESISKKMVLLR